MAPTVGICCYPSFGEADGEWAVVGIDVIRATTSAVSAVAAGRQCYPVASLEAALPLARRLANPLLAGELDGRMPAGFDLQNSPAELDRPVGLERPVILLSTSGTKMLCGVAGRYRTYVACLRNTTAQAAYLAARHERVMLVAGESRGEFRAEDRLCCARIGMRLLEAGFRPHDEFTREMLGAWGEAGDDAFVKGPSVRYLAETGQMHDLEFILDHVDDLDAVFELRDGQVVVSEPG